MRANLNARIETLEAQKGSSRNIVTAIRRLIAPDGTTVGAIIRSIAPAFYDDTGRSCVKTSAKDSI